MLGLLYRNVLCMDARDIVVDNSMFVLSNLAVRVKGGREKPGARTRQGCEHARGATHQN